MAAKALLIVAGLVTPLFAVAAQQLGWDDLGITVYPTEDPFFGLGFEEKRSLETVLKVASLRAKGSEIPSALVDLEAGARESLEQSNHNVERLIEQEFAFRKKIKNQRLMVREDLDGKEIRIPGYVLPLEFDGTLISEFLLVPYAGACIHTPPPPPSQIIHVKTGHGFEIGDLSTPVWVTGELKAKLSRQQAGLSDGTSSFDVGYEISGGSVEMFN